MRLSLPAVILLPLALAGCDLPGLVANGVKSYENRPEAKSDQPAPAAGQPVAAQAAMPAPATGGGVPPPEKVVVEPLK